MHSTLRRFKSTLMIILALSYEQGSAFQVGPYWERSNSFRQTVYPEAGLLQEAPNTGAKDQALANLLPAIGMVLTDFEAWHRGTFMQKWLRPKKFKFLKLSGFEVKQESVDDLVNYCAQNQGEKWQVLLCLARLTNKWVRATVKKQITGSPRLQIKDQANCRTAVELLGRAIEQLNLKGLEVGLENASFSVSAGFIGHIVNRLVIRNESGIHYEYVLDAFNYPNLLFPANRGSMLFHYYADDLLPQF